MTRTRKVRRSFVEERYAQLVEALYGARERLQVTSDIRYRDGKGFRMETNVQIRTVPEA